MIFRLILLALVTLFAVQALAVAPGAGDGGYVLDPGGGNLGCCAEVFPTIIEDDAQLLRDDFLKLSFQELLDQQILGTICENNNCGNLSETQASRLLDRAISYEREKLEAWDRFEAKWITRIGAMFTAAGLLIAWLAYRQSKEADRRSVRNEVEIEHLKDVDNKDTQGETT